MSEVGVLHFVQDDITSLPALASSGLLLAFAPLFFAGYDEEGKPEQGAFEVVVGKGLQLGDSVLGKARGFGVGGVDGFVAREDSQDVLMCDAVEGALL